MRVVRIYQQGLWHVGDQVTLSQPASYHILSVLRLQLGHALILFDGIQQVMDAQLVAVYKRRAVVHIKRSLMLPDEEPSSLHVVVAWLHTQAIDYVIQKSVELGVKSLSVVIAERSVGARFPAYWQRKQDRWQRIIINACEQCGQYRMPKLLPVQRGLLPWACDHQAVLQQSKSSVCFLTPDGAESLKQVYQAQATRCSWTVIVGPEGGWSEREKACAEQYGWSQIHMGPRMLRSETAALSALAVLQCLLRP